jgi:replication factor A1
MREMANKSSNSIVEHLAFLSVKHNIQLSELFQSLVSARANGRVLCKPLEIEYRGNVKKEAIFLITNESKVIGQFRVSEEFLQRKNIHFENWMNTDRVRRQIDKQNRGTPLFTQIHKLRHGMKKINLKAEVLETPPPLKVTTQYGSSATIANVYIGDETGKVRLCLWNEQVSFVSTGDLIQINNASVSTYKGERQLALGKSGTVSVLKHEE